MSDLTKTLAEVIESDESWQASEALLKPSLPPVSCPHCGKRIDPREDHHCEDGHSAEGSGRMSAAIQFTKRPNWREIPCPVPGCKAYTWGDVRVFVGIEPAGWHLSISTAYRYPTWDEIKQARYDFIPDEVTVAMILPPKAEYINIHNFCFHLHQISSDAGATA